MTLQGALRFDHACSYSPEQTIGPTNFLSTRFSASRMDGSAAKTFCRAAGWRTTLANGKTAVKVNIGKYENPASNLNNNYSISNPIARMGCSRRPPYSAVHEDQRTT